MRIKRRKPSIGDRIMRGERRPRGRRPFEDPPPASDTRALLTDAGYDLSALGALNLGSIALHAARLVGIRSGALDRRLEISLPPRDHPLCFCGAPHEAGTCDGSSSDHPIPLSAPARKTLLRITPLLSAEQCDTEIEAFVGLLRDDKALCRLRYDRTTLVRFLERHYPEGRTPEPDEDERLDRLAQRHAEATRPRVHKRLGARILAAAEGHERDHRRLRALATGLTFWLVEQGSIGLGGSILPPILMRLTLHDSFEAIQISDRLAADGGEVVELLRKSDPQSPSLWRRIKGMLGGKRMRRLMRHAQAMTDELRLFIERGEMPVGMPLVTLLPLLVRLPVATDEANKVKDEERAELSRAFEAALDSLCDEDAELFNRALGDWLAEPGDADPETVAKVQLLHDLPTKQVFQMFDFVLLKHCLNLEPTLVVDGEAELLDEVEGLKDPALLRAYAELLARDGLPEIAARTAALADLVRDRAAM